jgi:uncharacterized protein YdaU (DUF1376 family)
MTLRPSYTRFYASKWRSGTLMLSLEEEGLYIRVSAFQMECGQPLPVDWKEGARLLCVQPLKYRKTIDALVSKGLIVSTAEGLVCERAMLEFRRASKSVEGEKQDPPTNPRTNRDTYPDTNRDTMGVEAENEEQNQGQNHKRREEGENKESHTDSVVPEAAKGCAAKIDFDELENKLREACNGALANPAVAQGLFDLSIPIMWLNQGCDLEQDVIPTLRGIGKREHGKGIGSWSYFTRPVTEAKKRREAGLPDVTVASPAAPRISAARAVLEARKAREVLA